MAGACQRWTTTNQFEFQNPYSRRVRDFVLTTEPDCPPVCCPSSECNDNLFTLCPGNPCEPDCSHEEPQPINASETKPPWCQCLATGDPTCYEENREDTAIRCRCQCKKSNDEYITDLTKRPNPLSTHFDDFRNPDYPYIHNKQDIEQFLHKKSEQLKAEAPVPKPSGKTRRGHENTEDDGCGIVDGQDDEAKCEKKKIDKYMWTTSYREMNKDGAPLPITVIPIPDTSKEMHGDPIFNLNVNTDRCPVFDPNDIGNVWDRMQLRSFARRCDTISNDPYLDRCCGDKDSYFQEQYLNRAKFASAPTVPEVISVENIKLARENKLRLPFDKMIPYYSGFSPKVAPPICKIKKKFNSWDPYDCMSVYQAEFENWPQELYSNPVQPIRLDVDKEREHCMNPINALECKFPEVEAYRLSNYNPCVDCSKERERRCNAKNNPKLESEEPNLSVTVGSIDKFCPPCADIVIPCEYQKKKKPKEDILTLGTFVPSKAEMYSLNKGNLLVKKEYKACS